MARVTWQGWLALLLSALPLAPWAGDTARFWGMYCPEIPHLKPWGCVVAGGSEPLLLGCRQHGSGSSQTCPAVGCFHTYQDAF